MNFLKVAKVAFASLLLTSVAVFAETSQTEMTPYTDDKPVVTVISSQPVFVVKLKSNPTTGYSWFLREYNSNLLEPLKHSFEASTDKKLMGAPGFELWTFRVKNAGFVVPQQTSIRFIYSRPWEVEDASAKQIVFKVTMEGTSKK
jgi:inhibitor of cysteine peptidase